MLWRIVGAIAVGIAAWLICLLVNAITAGLDVPVLKQVGTFLGDYAVIIGFLFFLGALAAGATLFGRLTNRP